MHKITIGHDDCVVVCDGHKALLLRNQGDEVFPHLAVSEVLEQVLAPARAYGTDAPGRVHESTGSRRSNVEQANGHEKAEHAFLDHLSRHLDFLLRRGKTKRLVIVTPPHALGLLRSKYSGAVRKAVRSEVAKDLVAMPVYKIEQMLVTAH